MSQASADPAAKSENGLWRGEGVNILKKSFFYNNYNTLGGVNLSIYKKKNLQTHLS